MGKKSKFKKFRRIASNLPQINARYIAAERVSGSEVKAEELADGETLNPSATYKRKKVAERPLNHYRNMKKAYYRNGLSGVAGYANAVIRFTTAQQQKDEVLN